MTHRVRFLSLIAAGLVCVAAAPASAGASPPFLANLSTISPVGSTVPSNGDINPYGVAVVPRSIGSLVAGDTLVSNFNNHENEQGTGTTIVQVAPSGTLSVFAEITKATLPGSCPGGVGLTTALAILPNGYVVVGSLPTENGNSKTAQAGCLIVVSPSGKPVRTISGPPINGPWDMTSSSFFGGFVSVLYVSNVLNGTVAAEPETVDNGTVVRIVLLNLPGAAPKVIAENVIAEGFPERTDPAALVVGPTGLAVSGTSLLHQTLYVADSVKSRIAEVPNALLRIAPATGGGRTVTEGGDIDDPLGMTLAPNGNILTANGENSKLVETSPSGAEVASFFTELEPGGLFGLAITPDKHGILYVNDIENVLDLLH
jgi:hypothetical protein